MPQLSSSSSISPLTTSGENIFFVVGVGLGDVLEGAGGGGNLALYPNVFSQILCLSFEPIPCPKEKSK